MDAHRDKVEELDVRVGVSNRSQSNPHVGQVTPTRRAMCSWKPHAKARTGLHQRTILYCNNMELATPTVPEHEAAHTQEEQVQGSNAESHALFGPTQQQQQQAQQQHLKQEVTQQQPASRDESLKGWQQWNCRSDAVSKIGDAEETPDGRPDESRQESPTHSNATDVGAAVQGEPPDQMASGEVAGVEQSRTKAERGHEEAKRQTLPADHHQDRAGTDVWTRSGEDQRQVVHTEIRPSMTDALRTNTTAKSAQQHDPLGNTVHRHDSASTSVMILRIKTQILTDVCERTQPPGNNHGASNCGRSPAARARRPERGRSLQARLDKWKTEKKQHLILVGETFSRSSMLTSAPSFSLLMSSRSARLSALHVIAEEGRGGGSGCEAPGLGDEWKVGCPESPMCESEGEAWSEDESVSSGGSREGNVCNDALHVIGLRGPGGSISLFVKDWELAKVALRCHMALDMLCQEIHGAW